MGCFLVLHPLGTLFRNGSFFRVIHLFGRLIREKILINGMCLFVAWRRKAPTVSSVELASHTRLLATIVTCANCLLFALVLLFSFTQKTALSSYISHYRSLVFCVWKPCGCSTSEPISVVLFIGERVA